MLVLLLVASLLLLGLAGGIGVAVAAAESASPSPAAVGASPPSGNVVYKVGWTREPDNLNPFVGETAPSFEIWYLTYDSLVGYDPKTLAPMKGENSTGLATDWTHSADGLTWTFTIRKNAKWSDGVPLTAKDVAFTYNYVVQNKMATLVAYTRLIEKATAIDDYTVQFKCSAPKPDMVRSWVPILPEHIWSKLSPDDAANKFQNNPPIIGSGPFQVVKSVKGSYVQMVANKDYWAGAPKIDELVFRSYTNRDTMAEELQQGSIQYCDVSPAQFQRYTNKAGFTAQKVMYDSLENIGINCYAGMSDGKPWQSLGNPVLRDWRFRNALNWAIDRNKIAAIAYQGAAIPATGFLPSSFWKAPFDYHWDPPAGQAYTYDPAKAKALLAAAGYTDTNGDGYLDYHGKPISLRLWACNEKNELIVTGKLLAGWLKDIGIKVTYATMDDGALSAHLYNLVNGKFTPDYDLFIWDWDGDFDPGFLCSIFTTKQINGWSDCAWSDPAYDKLFEDQYKELDTAKRVQLIHQMEQIVYQQTPYIVYAYPEELQVYDTAHWQGWVQQPSGTGSLDNRWTYLDVRPKAGAAAAGSKAGIIAGIAAAAVVVVVAIVLLLTRRRNSGAAEEE